MHGDTSAEADAIRFERYARMTPAEKIVRMEDLTRAASMLALTGLRERYLQADERELLLRLAVLRLGADLVWRAYGWRAPEAPDTRSSSAYPICWDEP